MIMIFGAFIGVAILSLCWGLTAKPSVARANLFADLRRCLRRRSPGS